MKKSFFQTRYTIKLIKTLQTRQFGRSNFNIDYGY